MPKLSAKLYGQVRRDFFAVLRGPGAPVYVDALDALEQSAQGAGSLSRADAVEIVSETLREHPEFAAAEEFPDEQAHATTVRDQAGLVLKRLVETGWLDEPPRPDWQRIYHFSANGEVLLAALRQIAHGEATQFTDKIQLACAQLLNLDAFTESPFADLEACLANVREGLRELRLMENGIARHTRELLQAGTLKENLSVLYDQFSETIGHACYRELVRAQLPTRILKARRRLDELSAREPVLEQMQRERLRRPPECEPVQAANEIRLKWDELAHLLESVSPQADALDRRAADFARRAFARVRYLQEVGGGQREKVQALFTHVDEAFKGQRLSELPAEFELPALLLTETGIVSSDSMYRPRLRKAAGELERIEDDLTDEDRESAVLEVEGTLRDSMNVMRANRFAASLPGERGAIYTAETLPLHNDDDVADLIACLLHGGARDAAFEISVARVESDAATPAKTQRAGYAIEELTLKKK